MHVYLKIEEPIFILRQICYEKFYFQIYDEKDLILKELESTIF